MIRRASPFAHSPVEEPQAASGRAVTDKAAVSTRTGVWGRQSHFSGMKPRCAVAGLAGYWVFGFVKDPSLVNTAMSSVLWVET